MDANEPEPIRLDQFLKRRGVTGTGGQAKWLIQDGEVRVNGEVETRRRRKLHPGDVIDIGDLRLVVGGQETHR
jgi:ribosome-associated protein